MRVKSPARGNLWLLIFAVWFIFIALLTQGPLSGLSAVAMPAFMQIVGVFVPFLAYLFLTKQKPKAALAWRPLNARNALLTVIVSVAALPMILLVAHLTSFFVISTVDFGTTVDPAAFSIWAMLLTGVAFPVLFEEILLRGAIFGEYYGHKNSASIGVTIAVTALFFGFMHVNFHQAIYATMFGVVFGCLVYYTRSIIAPILGHFIVNASFGLLGYLTAFGSFMGDLSAGDTRPLLIILGANAVMLPIMIICLKKLQSYHIATQEKYEPVFEMSEKPKVFTWALWVALAIFIALSIMQEMSMRAAL